MIDFAKTIEEITAQMEHAKRLTATCTRSAFLRDLVREAPCDFAGNVLLAAGPTPDHRGCVFVCDGDDWGWSRHYASLHEAESAFQGLATYGVAYDTAFAGALRALGFSRW